MPAFVVGRFGDILTANPLAGTLSPAYRIGANLLRETFLNPAVRDVQLDWDAVTSGLAATLRGQAGPDAVDDPRLATLVGELSLRSERFRKLWARHDVRPQGVESVRLEHPQVGFIALEVEKLAVLRAPGLLFVVLHAEPGSPSAERLALLARLAQSAEPAPGEASAGVPGQFPVEPPFPLPAVD